jgi:UDP-N-acetylglucosamine diphosphorylase / glucose-1-phosphate thymidylyltransferase / UDP-N-acetylgalactosamine diphosphorylase / glucosamine-1-phosphate N-acetyltransferase / galactosamine-1-phosphate N-acetyltransferase
MFKTEDFLDLRDFEHSALFDGTEYVWDALKQLEAYVCDHVRAEVRCEVPATTVIQGDVFIGEGALIEPGGFIMGPTIIGKRCHIRQGAYIRGNVIVGDGAIVGHCTEVKRSILLPEAGAPHFNYVGDSILGRNCNLGAGSILSNFKLTGEEITIEVEGRTWRTGLQKFGGVVGDGTQVGCNAVLNPGTLLGPHSLVYPGVSLRGYLPTGTVVKLRQTRELEAKRPE